LKRGPPAEAGLERRQLSIAQARAPLLHPARAKCHEPWNTVIVWTFKANWARDFMPLLRAKLPETGLAPHVVPPSSKAARPVLSSWPAAVHLSQMTSDPAADAAARRHYVGGTVCLARHSSRDWPRKLCVPSFCEVSHFPGSSPRRSGQCGRLPHLGSRQASASWPLARRRFPPGDRDAAWEFARDSPFISPSRASSCSARSTWAG
jgi:hypothetical protein